MEKQLLRLIDDAARQVGGYAALARAIGVAQPKIPQMRAGKRAVTPETIGLLCDIAGRDGEECRKLAALAVVTNPKNKEKRNRLWRAFFGSMAAGAVLGPGLSTPTYSPGNVQTTMYRLSSRRLRWGGTLRAIVIEGSAPPPGSPRIPLRKQGVRQRPGASIPTFGLPGYQAEAA